MSNQKKEILDGLTMALIILTIVGVGLVLVISILWALGFPG